MESAVRYMSFDQHGVLRYPYFLPSPFGFFDENDFFTIKEYEKQLKNPRPNSSKMQPKWIRI